MDVLDAIKNRQSVRSYLDTPLADDEMHTILEAAIWAPSGKNGQPWKFKVVTDKQMIRDIAELSIYRDWMKEAPCFILVYLDRACSYHYLKDVQSCGAAIQNMMLAAYGLGLGSCWIGEILPHAGKIMRITDETNANLEFMGMITVGYARKSTPHINRNLMQSFLL